MIRVSVKIIVNTYQMNVRSLKVLSSVNYRQIVQNKTEESIKNDYHCTLEEWKSAKPFETLPGPKPLPMLGNTWRFLPKIGEYSETTHDVLSLLQKLYKQYGNIVLLKKIVGRETSVLLFDPGDIEKIYKLENIFPVRQLLPSVTYFRQNYRQDIFKETKGLVLEQGEEWYDFRNKVNPIMMQPKIIKQYIHPMDSVAKELIARIKSIRGSDDKLRENFWKEANKWSLENLSSLAMNAKLGSLRDDLSEDSLPAKMIHTAEDYMLLTTKLDVRPSFWRWIAMPTFKKSMKAQNDLVTMIQGIIEKATEEIKQERSSTNKDEREASVFEKLLKIDKNIAIVMATDMLLAGIDTTAAAFVTTLYYLSINKSKQDRLREEVKTFLPSKDSECTVDILSSMPYLKACLKEAARIFPVTSCTTRTLTKNAVVAGYQIPKGTYTYFFHMLVSQREDQFVKPTEYLPERWLKENVDTDISYKKAHPFCVMPFGFGSRSCIGKRFAELNLEVVVANVIRNFDVSWEGPAPERKTAIINYLTGPFHFVFKDVKQS